ncbi:dicarboxylate/amino acid:cation symporter [Pseudoxanthomonas yeongjuensis]|uniref:dicarboxylate/amino acid:cation symporter n=1 Tax=Pseudoxanthomonas yeongjuensis TaxID=377616 RepID=UPI001391F734|nr:dicarboxylate/amino acid:cation symporter [Pseudoxanthomonas yeongjuensis]KAF1717562.1 dicarboxylate/amino acid:cation symporter [Pseudoxanthomonas yeongjuensis]
MIVEQACGRAKLPLHWKMAIGFSLGLLLGLAVNATVGADADWVRWLTGHVLQPAGTLFLRLIFMLVLPLLFSALVVGVAEMGDVRTLGRIGWRTLAYTVIVSGIAVLIGLVLVNVLKPGAGVDPVAAQQLLAQGSERAQAVIGDNAQQPGAADMLLSLVPENVVRAASRNEILAVMFFALMIGVGLVLTKGDESIAAFTRAVDGLFKISMTLIGLVIRLAPYAVFCFMFNLAALFGWELLAKLGSYVLVVVLALALHLCVVYSVALKCAGWSPLVWFGRVQEAMLMAFSTASSNATLPTSLRVAEDKLKLPNKVSRFVLTVGATANQNGTALYEGVTVLFLAQFFGIHLDIGQQLLVMFVCILGGIGTAGVPAGSLPVVALICAMVGVPPESIGIILGVDRLLDMCRTTLNVTGDLVLATIVSKGEQDEDDPVQ